MRTIHTDSAESIYCLACNTRQSVQRQRIVFTTGYYRVGVPLGCCEACYSLSQIQEQFVNFVNHQSPPVLK
ncbi:hypothetical protein [Paenibacillus terrigena]|uniref:hypothetical protein n=1 Tax=Paenibacillus terrigena TaxID=369333 RepID=UPI0012EC7F42|nr:hypothetical protein [Paenibacillus terrigena]